MADVRKEGPFFVALKRIYTPFREDGGRNLLFAEGARLRSEDVEKWKLQVEREEREVPRKPATKSRKPQENK